MHLVPTPHALVAQTGILEVPKQITITSRFELSPRLRSALATFDFLDTKTTRPASHSICLERAKHNSPEESYRLSINPDGITLLSSSDSGFFRGLTTLGQIIRALGPRLPCLEIDDRPDLPVRGYMLDISRCKVPTMESLFKLVDTLAALKFNQLQIYTEHTFAYRNHKIVWENASPLTGEEIRKLDTYCYHRFIELVPNQNSFGHMDRWLRHKPYQHLAECPNGYTHPLLGQLPWGGTLKPNQDSLDFVAELYDELLPHFRSRLFNIGGDEPWELGQGWSRDRVAAKGKHRVYLDHLLRLRELVASRGKTMQFWGDIILESPELAKELSEDTIGLIWGYEAGHPFAEQCAAFRDSGLPFYVAPGTSAWNSIGGRQANAAANIETAIKQGIHQGAAGMLLTDWGDFGHHHFPPISYPTIVLASSLSWNQKVEESFDPIQALNTAYFNGQSPELAKAIHSLSDSTNAFAYQPENRTLLNDLLFANGDKLHDRLHKTSSRELESARSAFDELLDTLSSVNEPSESATLEKQELILATKLLRFASEKGLYALDRSSIDRHRLQSTIESLIPEYRLLWLRRNRLGGLDESVAYLKKSLETL